SSPVPFRQMIYKISTTNEGRFEQNFFKFANDPLRFSGEWEKENPFDWLTEDSLKIISGCHVLLALMNDNIYEGATNGTDCESDVPGAEYSISEIRLSNEALIIKERAFDKNGDQVWGDSKCGYIFKRIK
ncbi:MAG: CpcT/CpeT family chromophore lyase, partial [Ignavibacteria bacterium]|nr:CpcT/CpeT family chromophore lyase [Ignavibacteria bacterium]